MAGLVNLTIRAVSGRVLVIANAEHHWLVAWQDAKAHAVELKRAAQASLDPRVSYVIPAEVGAMALDVERAAALQIAASLHAAGAKAEEQADPQTVADQSAVLIRMGVPFGLSDDAKIQDEAWNAAQWSPELRKAPLVGVPSRERVGVPSLIQTPPRKLQ
jgi:hypothetical protein